jgi:hypothetical protein
MTRRWALGPLCRVAQRLEGRFGQKSTGFRAGAARARVVGRAQAPKEPMWLSDVR